MWIYVKALHIETQVKHRLLLQPSLPLSVFEGMCFWWAKGMMREVKYSFNWFICWTRGTHNIKYLCEHLNLNKTLTGVWPVARLLCGKKFRHILSGPGTQTKWSAPLKRLYTNCGLALQIKKRKHWLGIIISVLGKFCSSQLIGKSSQGVDGSCFPSRNILRVQCSLL